MDACMQVGPFGALVDKSIHLNKKKKGRVSVTVQHHPYLQSVNIVTAVLAQDE